MRLASRLGALERQIAGRHDKKVLPGTVFWDDELIACHEHPACDVEKANGRHYPRVIHLQWETDQ